MNIFTKKFLLMVVFMFVASVGVAKGNWWDDFWYIEKYEKLEVFVEGDGFFNLKNAAGEETTMFSHFQEDYGAYDLLECKNVKNCSGYVKDNTFVFIHAIPLRGTKVAKWRVTYDTGATTGECTDGNSIICKVGVSEYNKVVIKFDYSLPVSVNVLTEGKGTVTVTSTPPGINVGNCTNSTYCNARYSTSTFITITAKPDLGFKVKGWNVVNGDGTPTGECISNITATCIVFASGPKTVKATFVSFLYPITFSTDWGGTITVTSTPPGVTTSTPPSAVNCKNSTYCHGNYYAGIPVTIIATPSSSMLLEWVVTKDNGVSTGECLNTTSTRCVITASERKEVKAVFSLTKKAKGGSSTSEEKQIENTTKDKLQSSLLETLQEQAEALKRKIQELLNQ